MGIRPVKALGRRGRLCTVPVRAYSARARPFISTSESSTVPIIPAIIDKLGLGTVQFGLAYGVTNERGQVGEADAAAIIDAAVRQGIRVFDTAAAYGDSEAVLGRTLPAQPALKIVTKLPPLGGSGNTADGIERWRLTFERSLERLRRPVIHGLLLHRPDDLRGQEASRIADFLAGLKHDGKVARIGVSAYDRAQIDLALERLPLDLVQLPFNLLDQRFRHDGTLSLLRTRGVEVHARSVFLQGSLLAEPARLPDHFAPFRGRFAAVAAAATAAGLSRLALCLRFVLEEPSIDCAVVGVTRLAEFRDILAAAGQAPPLPGGLAQLASDDAALIDPSRWPPAKAS